MVRFDQRTGYLNSTDLGRTASHFYIKYDTIEVRLNKTNKQKDRQTDRQTDRQRDRQTDRQTDRQAGRQAFRQTDIIEKPSVMQINNEAVHLSVYFYCPNFHPKFCCNSSCFLLRYSMRRSKNTCRNLKCWPCCRTHRNLNKSRLVRFREKRKSI